MKSILKSEGFLRFLAFLGALYIRLVYATTRWKQVDQRYPKEFLDQNKPFIVAFWHSQLGMLCKAWAWPDRSFNMLISAHKDGILIAKTVGHFGIATIPGSTNRGGTQALRHILKELKAGHVIGITPDGPRGPAKVSSEGVAVIARLAGVPIIPVTFSTSRRRVLSTWDRFYLALPFSRGVFVWGQPIFPERRDVQQLCQQVEEGLEAIQTKADGMVS